MKDYDKWKKVYDEGKKMIKSKGGKRQTLFKNSANPNELVILTEVEDMGKAKQMVESEELKQAMQNGGVDGEPTIFFLEKLEDVPL